MSTSLSEELGVESGLWAVIGSGGKTSLLRHLAGESAQFCLLTTTTRMFPPSDLPMLWDPTAEEVRGSLAQCRVACVGAPAEHGKLQEPSFGVRRLCELAPLVLVEADGSKRLPLKAHERWEPAVPEDARTLLVVGSSGWGRPVVEVAHRAALWCQRADCPARAVATPEQTARVIEAELARGQYPLPEAVLVNQVDGPDGPERRAKARRLARALHDLQVASPVYAVSLVEGTWARCHVPR